MEPEMQEKALAEFVEGQEKVEPLQLGIFFLFLSYIISELLASHRDIEGHSSLSFEVSSCLEYCLQKGHSSRTLSTLSLVAYHWLLS